MHMTERTETFAPFPEWVPLVPHLLHTDILRPGFAADFLLHFVLMNITIFHVCAAMRLEFPLWVDQ